MSHAYQRRARLPNDQIHSGSDANSSAEMLEEFAEARAQQVVAERQQLWRGLVDWLGRSIAITVPFALLVAYGWSYTLRLKHMDVCDSLRRRLRELRGWYPQLDPELGQALLRAIDAAIDNVHADVMGGKLGIGHRGLVLSSLSELRADCLSLCPGTATAPVAPAPLTNGNGATTSPAAGSDPG